MEIGIQVRLLRHEILQKGTSRVAQCWWVSQTLRSGIAGGTFCRGLAEVQREAGWLPCETAGVAGRAGGLRAFLSGARDSGLTPGSSGFRVTSAASPASCGDGGDLGNFTWMAVLKREGLCG